MPSPEPPHSARPAPGALLRGRLAPSTTGRLHLGHARSFLAAWWSARAAGGEVLLRIEDLDGSRCRPEFEQDAFRDLEWLGLNWDGPVLRQSDDLSAYEAAVEQLLEQGLAYACTCSRAEILAARSAPHAADAELRYPGTCRGRWSNVAAAEASTGAPAGVRFLVPDGAIEIIDGRVGAYRGCPSKECGDFLLLRRDAVVAYQLAVVVDDARQGITEVVRGADLLSSTLRQSLLQDALGLPHPAWYHLPLVNDEQGRRLSKRDGATELAELRDAGVAPARIVRWAALSLGIAPERLDGGSAALPSASELTAELTDAFSWERVPPAEPRTDRKAFEDPPTD